MTLGDEDPGNLYRDAKPLLDQALKSYKTELEALLQGRVADFYVTGRVKSARSLIRKLRESPNTPRSWESIRDKVGLRVICSTRAECKTIDMLIDQSGWTLLDRKIKTGEPDQLFYPGIHLIVQDLNALDHQGTPVPCEIQIRTRAQDAWAAVSHKLSYKGVIQPPRRMQRVISRLTIVVEMFDDDVHRLFRKRKRLPNYRAATILEHLEAAYERLTLQPMDGAPDLSVVNILLSAYTKDELPNIEKIIDEYIDENSSSLSELISNHQPIMPAYVDSRDWLFTQPEILLVLERACNRKYLLADALKDTDIEVVARQSCVSAGEPLP